MKKSDMVYFNNFKDSVDCSYRAAKILLRVLENFNVADVKKEMDELHIVEHEGDTKKHEIMKILSRAFITPIEREDVVELCGKIDDITDSIEDVLIHIYICQVKEIKPEAIEMVKVAIACCETLKLVMDEFSNFKHSAKLKDGVIKINDLEEEGDRLYIQSMYDLHSNCTNPLEVIAWRDIYGYIEKCIDRCEEAADIVEMVIMKNS